MARAVSQSDPRPPRAMQRFACSEASSEKDSAAGGLRLCRTGIRGAIGAFVTWLEPHTGHCTTPASVAAQTRRSTQTRLRTGRRCPQSAVEHDLDECRSRNRPAVRQRRDSLATSATSESSMSAKPTPVVCAMSSNTSPHGLTTSEWPRSRDHRHDDPIGRRRRGSNRLDRPRAEQNLPMRAPGRNRECGGHGDGAHPLQRASKTSRESADRKDGQPELPDGRS